MSKETETSQPLSSLYELMQLSESFEQDRPLLAMRNAPHLDFIPNPDGKGYTTRSAFEQPINDVTSYKKLLLGEISEFNGGADHGYFAEPENREDYRQQEVSDMVLFILAYFKGLGSFADGQPFLPSEPRVLMMTHAWLKALEIEPVTAVTMPGKVDRFSIEQEKKFLKLKNSLNQQRDALSATPATNLGVIDRLKIKNILEQTLAVCFAIHHLMRVNPIRQVGEKISRNYLRYLAHMLGMQYVPNLPPGLTLEERREAVESAYRVQAKKVHDLWDGPVGSDGRRPGHGTHDFYSQGTYDLETPTASDGVDVKSTIEPNQPIIIFDSRIYGRVQDKAAV